MVGRRGRLKGLETATIYVKHEQAEALARRRRKLIHAYGRQIRYYRRQIAGKKEKSQRSAGGSGI
jgi:hypothetical protein